MSVHESLFLSKLLSSLQPSIFNEKNWPAFQAWCLSCSHQKLFAMDLVHSSKMKHLSHQTCYCFHWATFQERFDNKHFRQWFGHNALWCCLYLWARPDFSSGISRTYCDILVVLPSLIELIHWSCVQYQRTFAFLHRWNYPDCRYWSYGRILLLMYRYFVHCISPKPTCSKNTKEWWAEDFTTFFIKDKAKLNFARSFFHYSYEKYLEIWIRKEMKNVRNKTFQCIFYTSLDYAFKKKTLMICISNFLWKLFWEMKKKTWNVLFTSA